MPANGTTTTNGLHANGINVSHGSTAPSTRLRQMLAGPEVVVAPGVFDGISAHLAMSTGPKAIYMTGAGTTASRLGLPDLVRASIDALAAHREADDFVANASMISSIARDTPLICDADVGFGGPAQVARTVERYVKAGVAALHIEDQVAQKRCGHLLGKQLAPEAEFLTRIRAAALGRERSRSDIVIIARSDAIQSLGIAATVNRLRKAAEAGADLLFPEGMRSREDVEACVKGLAPYPCLLNLVAGGSTPDFTVNEAQAMGVKLVIFPGAAFSAAALAMKTAYETLKTEGTDANVANGMSPREFFEMVGLKEALALDAQAGGAAYASGV